MECRGRGATGGAGPRLLAVWGRGRVGRGTRQPARHAPASTPVATQAANRGTTTTTTPVGSSLPTRQSPHDYSC